MRSQSATRPVSDLIALGTAVPRIPGFSGILVRQRPAQPLVGRNTRAPTMEDQTWHDQTRPPRRIPERCSEHASSNPAASAKRPSPGTSASSAPTCAPRSTDVAASPPSTPGSWEPRWAPRPSIGTTCRPIGTSGTPGLGVSCGRLLARRRPRGDHPATITTAAIGPASPRRSTGRAHGRPRPAESEPGLPVRRGAARPRTRPTDGASRDPPFRSACGLQAAGPDRSMTRVPRTLASRRPIVPRVADSSHRAR
jgi:hypothetical protein